MKSIVLACCVIISAALCSPPGHRVLGPSNKKHPPGAGVLERKNLSGQVNTSELTGDQENVANVHGDTRGRKIQVRRRESMQPPQLKRTPAITRKSTQNLGNYVGIPNPNTPVGETSQFAPLNKEHPLPLHVPRREYPRSSAITRNPTTNLNSYAIGNNPENASKLAEVKGRDSSLKYADSEITYPRNSVVRKSINDPEKKYTKKAEQDPQLAVTPDKRSSALEEPNRKGLSRKTTSQTLKKVFEFGKKSKSRRNGKKRPVVKDHELPRDSEEKGAELVPAKGHPESEPEPIVKQGPPNQQERSHMKNWRVDMVKPIGTGAHSIVYEGHMVPQDGEVGDGKLNVAVKVTSVYSDYRKRVLLGELTIISRLESHGSFPRLYGARVIEHLLFVCMERMAASVEDVIRAMDGKPIPLPVVELWFKQLLIAIRYLKKVGLVHRDIKPNNLLLTFRGVAKLTDFDLAVPEGTPHDMDLGPEHLWWEKACRTPGALATHLNDVFGACYVVHWLFFQKPFRWEIDWEADKPDHIISRALIHGFEPNHKLRYDADRLLKLLGCSRDQFEKIVRTAPSEFQLSIPEYDISETEEENIMDSMAGIPSGLEREVAEFEEILCKKLNEIFPDMNN